MLKNFTLFCGSVFNKMNDEQFFQLLKQGSEEIGKEEFIKYAFHKINKDTVFEYAYHTKQYAYCDTCLQYWFDHIKPTNKQTQKLYDVLSMVSQPPMNTIIKQPVFVCYEGERSFDLMRMYEKAYVEKILEMNSQNCLVEEPSFAHVMTASEHENLQVGEEVITQIDTYDACFMNTKCMTNGDVKKFIHEGAFRKSFKDIEDILPLGKSRRAHDGIHFVEMTPKKKNILGTEPLLYYSFERFESFFFYQVLKENLWSQKKFDEIVQVHMSINYDAATVLNNTVQFGFQFECDNTVYYVGFAFSYISALKNDDKTVLVVTLKEEGKDVPVLEFAYNILVFIAGQRDVPFSLLCDALNEDYNHETERIVCRAKVVGKLLTFDECLVEVEENGKKYMVSDSIINASHNHSFTLTDRLKFTETMQKLHREVLFKDKSYALKFTQIGLFTIPQTVYCPNQIRLSNGKRPKKFKTVMEFRNKRRNYKSFFNTHLNKISTFKTILNSVSPKPKVASKAAFESIEQLKTCCFELISQQELLKFHETLTTVDFQMKNKFIMALRANNDLPFTFSQLYGCIMSKERCMQLMDTETPLQKWLKYFEGKSKKTPPLQSFDVAIENLPVSKYIQLKLKEKLCVDQLSITPLVLALLLKFNIDETILNHGKNILLTDDNYYPIHFVLNFVDCAVKRATFTEILIRAEINNASTPSVTDLIRIYKKWEQDKKHCCLFALFEWPFDNLLQSFFLLHIYTSNVTQKLFVNRSFRTLLSDLFAYMPGLGVLELKMENYGYPEGFVESWRKGIDWFFDIGFTNRAYLQMTIDKLLSNKTIAKVKGKDKIVALYQEYEESYIEERDKYASVSDVTGRIEGFYSQSFPDYESKFTFENIFMNKNFNIHYESDRVRKSFFTELVNLPHEWDHPSFLQLGKLMMYYLSCSPKVLDTFTSVGGIYIDLKASLFAQVKIDPTVKFLKRRRMMELNYITMLAKKGGTERQIMFLMGLQTPVNKDFGYLRPYDVHHMLCDTVDYRLFKSDFLSAKYIVKDTLFPVVLDNAVHLLACESLFDTDVLHLRIDNKICILKHFLDFYFKTFSFDIVSHTIKTDYDDLHISYVQNKYLTAIERIQYMLIQVIHKLHDISCRVKKPFAPIFLAIIHNKYWKDNYMADILRFEKKHFHKMRASLFTHASILLRKEVDLGKIWWRTWANELKSENELKGELLRIFNSKEILTHSRASDKAEDLVNFCNQYIIAELEERKIQTVWKYGSSSNKEAYLHLGTCIMDFFHLHPGLIATKDKKVEDNKFNEALDTLLSKVIISMHANTIMNPVYKGQNLFFLHEISRSVEFPKSTQAYDRFNHIIEYFIDHNLPNSMRLFLESFEKHFDYLNENQLVENAVKPVRYWHCNIRGYMKHFQVKHKNLVLITAKHLNKVGSSSTYGKYPLHVHQQWCAVLTKLLIMGLVDWKDFQLLVDSSSPFELMFKRHDQLIDFFYEQNQYHFPYFVQQGVNPLTMKNITCVNNAKLTWRQQIFKSNKKRGWPMKLFFPTNFLDIPVVYCEDMCIDYLFTFNDGVEKSSHLDYLDKRGSQGQCGFVTVVEGKHKRMRGRFILEAQTMIAQTLLHLNGSNQEHRPVLTKDFLSFIDDFQNYACEANEICWNVKHGIIKSENVDGSETFIHEKVDLVSLATIICSDFTSLKMKKMFNKFDEQIVTLSNVIEDKKEQGVQQRMFFLNYLCRHLCSSFSFLLQFSDNIKFFDVAFKRMELFCYRLHLPPTCLFLGDVVRVKTSFDIKSDKLVFYTHDILTFAVQYGRTAHVKYLLNWLCMEFEKGYKLDRLYTRFDKTSIKHSFHSLYFSTDACPYQHLLCTAVRHGHVKTFSHLITMIPLSHLELVNWRTVIEDACHLVKYDAVGTDDCIQILERKRKILEKILKSEKLKKFATNMAAGVDGAIRYLCGFKYHVYTAKDFFRYYTPHFAGTSRILMRSEILLWGEHIFNCFMMFEQVTSDCISITAEVLVNLSLFYSTNLIDFCLKRLDKSSIDDAIVHYAKIMETKDYKFIEDLFQDNEMYKFKCILLFFLLQMETLNKSLSIQELIRSDYLEYIIENFLAGDEKESRNVSIYLNLIATQRFALNAIVDFLFLRAENEELEL